MDSESLALSHSELAMVIGALLEPHENPEIGQARLLLALKLHPYLCLLDNPTSGLLAVNASVPFSGEVSASHAQVLPIFFLFCWYVKYLSLGHSLGAFRVLDHRSHNQLLPPCRSSNIGNRH